MALEILDYRYITDWDFENLFSDTKFNEQIHPDFPLITATWSGSRPEATEKMWREFINGKKRGRPSDIIDSEYPSINAISTKTFGNNREVFNLRATCASSIYALYLAGLISQDKQLPVVIFCADNKNTAFDHWQFSSLGAIDNNTGRPFDSSSKGLRMGTGGAVFIVKHSSVKSQLTAKAAVTNCHFYTNSTLATNPGPVDDLINNLSKINYKSVDLWNAHATGTPVGDRVEYDFFNRTIQQDIPIVGFKGYIGHCMCAAGAIEIAMALDCKKQNNLLPNIIHNDKIVNDSRIITTSTSFSYNRMLKTSLGFGGICSAAEIDLW